MDEIASNQKIQIRFAEEKDCARMMELVHELAVFEKEPDAVIVSLEHFTKSGFGEKPVWRAFVAIDETSERVIGFALWYIRYSTWKGQRMYLEDLIVTAEMRGKGAGSLLFESLIEECRVKDYSGLVWQVLDWNIGAIDFYKKYDAVFDAGWLNARIDFNK